MAVVSPWWLMVVVGKGDVLREGERGWERTSPVGRTSKRHGRKGRRRKRAGSRAGGRCLVVDVVVAAELAGRGRLRRLDQGVERITEANGREKEGKRTWLRLEWCTPNGGLALGRAESGKGCKLQGGGWRRRIMGDARGGRGVERSRRGVPLLLAWLGHS